MHDLFFPSSGLWVYASWYGNSLVAWEKMVQLAAFSDSSFYTSHRYYDITDCNDPINKPVGLRGLICSSAFLYLLLTQNEVLLLGGGGRTENCWWRME